MTQRKIRNRKELKPARSYLRKNMPAPEVVLWQKLRKHSLGVKFRRQFSVENYILDLYSPTTRLAIELDGNSHFFNAEVARRDRRRDLELEKYGIKVLRFTNHDVMSNLEGVYTRISEELAKSTPS